ncbi:MAG: pyruvate ferredoxin oxidoreductase [Actinobacteria bacterium]|nr:pyruvate ferredoxin oxidoreductase [Actinomycetota bacterium]
MANLRELSKRKDKLSGGHRLCAGCAASIIVRQILMAANNPTVVACATGCLEVSTTIYPYTAWRDSYIHNAFENAAATISGVESAYKSLKKQGKINNEIKFVAFGGDGGTYDIGFQSLSGAFERGHNIVYVCYDNGAYMNTGIQRSSATPIGAATTTTPIGSQSYGKKEYRKDLTVCMAAHNVPYVAQASPSKWRHPSNQSVEMARLAVQTNYWPLYEVEYGKWKLNHKPKERKPIVEWLKPQGRFSHLFKPGNEAVLEEFQKNVDLEWERLLKRCEA